MDFEKIMSGVRLAAGSHYDAGPEMCAMEMVAWLEGEKHSDKPACACPVIGRFVIGLNDRMRDAERNRLLPFLPRIVGTNQPEFRKVRAELLAWKALTVFAPLVLEISGFEEHAAKLRSISMPKNQEEWIKARKLALVSKKDAYAAYAAADAAYAAADAAYAAAFAAAAAADAAAAAADAFAAAAGAAGAAGTAAAGAARSKVIDEWLIVLDAVLKIGPPSHGFSRPLPSIGETAKQLGMVA